MSLELPKQTINQRRPDFGDRTYLQLMSKLEDDINIPTNVRMSFLSHTLAALITAAHSIARWC